MKKKKNQNSYCENISLGFFSNKWGSSEVLNHFPSYFFFGYLYTRDSQRGAHASPTRHGNILVGQGKDLHPSADIRTIILEIQTFFM